MTKRILILGEIPPNTITGISISNQRIIDVLKANGLQVTVVEENSWSKRGIIKIISYFRIYNQVLKTLKKLTINCFYFNLPLSKLAQLKLLPVLLTARTLSRKTRIIGHIHRGDINKYIKSGSLNRVLLRLFFKTINKLIILSSEFFDDVHQFHQDIETMILHNTSEFENKKVHSFISKKKQYNFLCVSNYIKTKGIEELVECFKLSEFSENKLSIYGNKYSEKFYDTLNKNCPGNVILNGPANRIKVQEELLKTDCLILPSWNEGQPLIVLEAMSLGIPIIASRVGDIPNMLGKDYNFFVKPKDIQNLTNVVKKFINWGNKKQISKHLLDKYNKDYSNNLFEIKLLNIFADC